MVKEKRHFCCHQNFVPNVFSGPARGYIHVEKHEKKNDFKVIALKLVTNGQSDKGFLLTTFVKALKYIPGLGVR